MYLTYLVYQCSKAAANYGDPSFNYDSFLTGQANKDEDYSAFIDKSLPVINEFLQRSYELNKLPSKVVSVTVDEKGEFDLPDDYGKGISLFQIKQGQLVYPVAVEDWDGSIDVSSTAKYQVVGFRKKGKKGFALSPFDRFIPFFLQYRAKPQYITEDDLISIEVYDRDDETVYECNGIEYASRMEAVEAQDIDLEEAFGFSDSLASICIAFCQGRLMDDRSEGHSREMEAETRLDDITLDETLFLQTKTVRAFK